MNADPRVGRLNAGSGRAPRLPRAWLIALSSLSLVGCWQFRGPPRDGECRSNLRSAISLELGFFEVKQRFSTHPAEVGFAPTSGNRYLYLFDARGEVTRRDGKRSPPPLESVGIGADPQRGGATDWLRARLPPDVEALLGPHGVCPACNIVLGCVGNIDDDDDVDVWSISTEPRVSASGAPIPQGTAYRHLSDRNP